jgi:hypothetical protein
MADENEQDELQSSPEYQEIMRMLSNGQSGKRVMDAMEKFVQQIEDREKPEEPEEDDLPEYWANVRKTELL